MKMVHKNAMGENWDELINPEGEVLKNLKKKGKIKNVNYLLISLLFH